VSKKRFRGYHNPFLAARIETVLKALLFVLEVPTGAIPTIQELENTANAWKKDRSH
jgi:hypothetical protein